MGVIQKDFRIQEAVRFMNENPCCTLAELARRCHLGISRLSHLFKAETGLTVEKYRRNCRFQVAAYMLATTDLAIKQIAQALGYHHTYKLVPGLLSNSQPERLKDEPSQTTPGESGSFDHRAQVD